MSNAHTTPLTDDEIHRSLRDGWPQYVSRRVDELRAVEVIRLCCPHCGAELERPQETWGRDALPIHQHRNKAFTVRCTKCVHRSTGVFYR